MIKKPTKSKVGLQIMEYFNLLDRLSVKRKIFLIFVVFLSFTAEIMGLC